MKIEVNEHIERFERRITEKGRNWKENQEKWKENDRKKKETKGKLNKWAKMEGTG